jgi:Inner membrane protein YgaP-like, transmembrane domain
MSSVLAVNEHPIERVVRVVAGLALVWAAYSGRLGLWAYIGVVPLLTGLTGICPLYSMLGISTCSGPSRR